MKNFCKPFSLFLCICLFLSSCSSKMVLPNRLSPEKTPVLQEYDYTKFSPKQLLEEIKALNKILSQKNIAEKEYENILNRLELLGQQIKVFESIKFNRKEISFTIPANSKTTFSFKSYCLNPGGASPAQKEQFVFRKNPPDIPLYKEIMTYTNSGQEIKAVNKQLLLWNLKNNVKFENLPQNQQEFLFKMDPMSYLKINNLITSKLKSNLTKFAKEQVPLYNQVKDAVSLVKGKAHTYEEYARNIENMAVKAKLVDNAAPIRSDGYDGVFTQTLSSGFSGTTITFVNTNPFPIAITCSAFLDPFRKGVQPIGFDFPKLFEEYEKYEDEIMSELDKLLVSLYKWVMKKLNKENLGDYKSLEDNVKNNKIGIFFFLFNGAEAWIDTHMQFGYNGIDDESDAFRHALWNAYMVSSMGTVKAEEFASNHEISASQDSGREMDLHNNKIGREIGEELSKKGFWVIRQDYINAVLANKDRLQIKERTGSWGK